MNLSDCVVPRKVEIPDGAYGVWQIPELNIIIPLYPGSTKDKTMVIIDAENSASIRRFGAGRIIEDHAESKAGSGRWRIGRVRPDTIAFLVLPDKTEQYVCNRVLRAYRHPTCYTCDGVGVYPRSATDILCVCCAVYNANPSGSKISMKLWAGRTLTNNSFMGSSDWILNSISGLNTVRELNNNLYPVKGTEVSDLGLTGYFGFNSSTPLTLNIPTNFGALCCCMLQGTGFVVLSVFHRTTNEVVVTDLATKQSFSSSFVTISAPNEATVKFESTVASRSFISAVAPQSIKVTV